MMYGQMVTPHHTAYCHTITIDTVHTYGYETNHVSTLISITSSGSILMSCIKKVYPGFAILHGDGCLQLLQIINISGFVEYLQGKTAN